MGNAAIIQPQPSSFQNHAFGSVAAAGNASSTAITIASTQEILVFGLNIHVSSGAAALPAWTTEFRLGTTTVEIFGVAMAGTPSIPYVWMPPAGLAWTNATAGNFTIRLTNNHASAATTFWTDLWYAVRNKSHV